MKRPHALIGGFMHRRGLALRWTAAAFLAVVVLVLAPALTLGPGRTLQLGLGPVAAQASPPPSPPPPPPPPPPAACNSSVGPGVPPPAGLTFGYEGFHAAWYGQSGYPTLCPGDASTATVAFYNTGTRGWVLGRLGEVAYLGTWIPEPGQDLASPLGGDGTNGSPNTGWPRYNRVAVQPAAYVGPGQVAWFQFTVRAPSTPGRYRLYIRALIEGAQWLEDYGIYWPVTVLNRNGTLP